MKRLWTWTAAVALVLGGAATAGAQNQDASAQLLDGSFRGTALRGLLPERILSGREEPEARASGDFDGRRGPELAVVYREGEALVLTLLGQKDGGAWRKLAEFRRDHPAASRIEFLGLERGGAQPLLVHWFVAGSARMGQIEVFALRQGADTPESVLSVPATTYRLETISEDSAPCLVASVDAPGVAGVPEFFRWDGQRFVTPVRSTPKLYAAAAKRFQAEGDSLVKQNPRGQPVPLAALDNLLNAARCLEQSGQKDEAFRAYRRVTALSRSGLLRPRKSDEQQPLRDMRTVEAREGMTRLLGRTGGTAR